MGDLERCNNEPTEPKEALSSRSLYVRFGNNIVLEDVNFVIPRGACCAVVGPNGGGKSTLLKCALGLVKPAHGSMAVLGSPYLPKTHRVAYIPQRSAVDWDFPATVFDAVLMGIEKIPPRWSRDRKTVRTKILEYLDSVGMKHLAKRPLKQLSGGQQQRVFFARSMAQKAELYLMDEPFSGVDAKTEKDLVFLLQEICNLGKTVVVIHHNIQTVPNVFDQVLFLNGTVIGCGEMKRTWTSANLTRTFAQREQRPLSQEKLEELKTEGIRHFF